MIGIRDEAIMKYYPMHMHLHTVHQPGASMEGHIFNAHTLGMKYIRFTDHDTRTGSSEKTVNTFDFSRGVFEYVTEQGITCSWKPLYDCTPVISNSSIVVISTGEKAGVIFQTSEKKHTRALLADVTLTLSLKHNIKPGARIIIDIALSERPPQHEVAHFSYVLGEPIAEYPEYMAGMPLPLADDGLYVLKVSDDIAKFDKVGGLDNVFGAVSIIIEGEGEFALSRFDINSIYEYDELIKRQRLLAVEIGKTYGVYPFVTTEISGAGQHKNCYSSHVPILDYSHGKISEEEAIAHVLSHNGIFAYNHPFEARQYKKKVFTREQLDEIVAYESDRLAKSKLFGASAVEVAFPIGRGAFSFDDYLKLWDNLSLAGVFVTGVGDSDSHNSKNLWFNGNNFATWFGVEDDLSYPIEEAVFNESLLAGNVYMGDPVFLKGDVSFHCLGANIGSVIKANSESYPVSLSLANFDGNLTARIIENGNCVYTEEFASRSCEINYSVTPSDNITFVRAELYNADGRCIMLTNPIWFVGKNYQGEIPNNRLVDLDK